MRSNAFAVPGPKSKFLARALGQFECREVTYTAGDFPVFWEKAKGPWVWDADGIRYLDMTAAFAVANLGHGHPALVRALTRQSRRMIHGMGDVHPPAVKVKFLAALAKTVPRPLGHAILSQNGADAVESAVKTALVAAAGQPGIVAFKGSYHGLSLGALSLTDRGDFRAGFESGLSRRTLFVDYPYCYRCPLKLKFPTCRMACVDDAARRIRKAGGRKRFAAVIVEPIQGRGGMIVPPPGWLARLAEFCRKEKILLIVDEIYTGFGRTGKTFACDHDRVVPDLMCLGKGMTGGFPMSACVGKPGVMNRWPRSDGEAVHTSTFLGNPLGCAMGLAALAVYKKTRLADRSARLGLYFLGRLRQRLSRFGSVGDIRGRGLMIGVELVQGRASKTPAPRLCGRMIVESLRRGVILLGGGPHRNVISLSPPLTVEKRQIDFCIDVVEDALKELGG